MSRDTDDEHTASHCDSDRWTDESADPTANATDDSPAEPDVEWAELPVDPDVKSALGYEWGELDIVTASDNEEKAVVLPVDEEMIRDDAFLVVATDCVYDVVNMR